MKNIKLGILVLIGLLFSLALLLSYSSRKEEKIWDCWKYSDGNTEKCVKVRADKVNSLMEKENAKPKTHLEIKERLYNLVNFYKSEKYGFVIYYPNEWSLINQDTEGVETVDLTNESGSEIHIGSAQIYSTSGALCANTGCDYNAGTVKLDNGSVIDLIKQYGFVNDAEGVPVGTKVDFYRFSFPLENYRANGFPLTVTASFSTLEQGDEILNIVSSLK